MSRWSTRYLDDIRSVTDRVRTKSQLHLSLPHRPRPPSRVLDSKGSEAIGWSPRRDCDWNSGTVRALTYVRISEAPWPRTPDYVPSCGSTTTKPPKKSDRTIIAKVTPSRTGARRRRGDPLGQRPGGQGGRGVARLGPDASARERIASRTCGRSSTSAWRGRGGDRKLSMFSGSAEAGRRGFRRDDSRDSQRGAAPGAAGRDHTCARGDDRRKSRRTWRACPTSSTPSCRRCARCSAGAPGREPDPMASRQWAHGAIRLGHARAAAGFKNATGLTVAVVDSGIDERHPDLKPRDRRVQELHRRIEEGFRRPRHPCGRHRRRGRRQRPGDLGRVRREDPGAEGAAPRRRGVRRRRRTIGRCAT